MVLVDWIQERYIWLPKMAAKLNLAHTKTRLWIILYMNEPVFCIPALVYVIVYVLRYCTPPVPSCFFFNICVMQKGQDMNLLKFFIIKTCRIFKFGSFYNFIFLALEEQVEERIPFCVKAIHQNLCHKISLSCDVSSTKHTISYGTWSRAVFSAHLDF
jgi:hypothetical protein